MDSEEQQPKKRKRGRPRKNPEADTSSTPKKSAPKKVNPKIAEQSKLALMKEIVDEQSHTLTNIEGYLTEFLDDFIVIGHTLGGTRVNITHAMTPKDFDCLEQYFLDSLMLMKAHKAKMLNDFFTGGE